MDAKAQPGPGEAERLERLWGGSFGTEYAHRNAEAGAGREAFWTALLAGHPASSICEVGCNVGANLRWLVQLVDPGRLYGVDVNHEALREVRHRFPDLNAVRGLARELPFRDGLVELAFTTGVLIHQPDESLPEVMDEIVRISSRYVLCGEYFAPTTEEVRYRGQEGALFRRDYGRLYAERFPDLRLLETGFLDRESGWDDVTWWLFEKPGP